MHYLVLHTFILENA